MMQLAAISLLFTVALGAVSDPCSAKEDCGSEDYMQCCGFKDVGGGKCYDNRYMKCCSNSICASWATCCNTECCNGKQTCTTAKTLDKTVDTCSAIEHMSAAQSYIVVAFPILLGVGSLVFFIFSCLMVYMYKVRFTFPAVSVSIVALIVFIFSFCLILSPHALQALFICAVASLALASVAATTSPQAPTHVLLFTIVATVIAFLLIINPLASNSLFSFSPNYPTFVGAGAGGLVTETRGGQGGVLGSLLASLSPAALSAANSDAGFVGFSSCPSYYLGYFRRDPALYADAKVHDPSMNDLPHGLCSRGYLLWNAICATVLACALPLLVITLLARLLEVRGVIAAWPAGASRSQPTQVHPARTSGGGYNNDQQMQATS